VMKIVLNFIPLKKLQLSWKIRTIGSSHEYSLLKDGRFTEI
jgi:hypothetical protein